jgi:hypothetical protein
MGSSLTPKTIKEFLFNAGDVFLPQRVRQWLQTFIIGSPKTLFYITYWSIVHFLSGVASGAILGASGVRGGIGSYTYYLALFVIHWLWESLQIVSGMTPLTLRGGIDVVVDTAMFMGGGALLAAAW